MSVFHFLLRRRSLLVKLEDVLVIAVSADPCFSTHVGQNQCFGSGS